ncbi:MAG: hypothetical protein M3N18_10330 [Actinomycetota bacterium]|nr:hypothetical protein [Actinomycetota bacterium]
METKKKLWAVLAVLALSLALAGCSDGAGLDDEGGIGADDDVASSSRESRFEEDGSGGYRETKIGGFSVEGPGDEEISIPEAEADPGKVAAYTESVQSILEDDPRGFSSLVDPEAGLQGETVNLGLQAESVEEALEANEGAYEELQQLDTPSGLGEVQDGLVDSRERAISAYDNINQAFVKDASAGEVADAVEESLPEIEYSEAETRALLQELERASGA